MRLPLPTVALLLAALCLPAPALHAQENKPEPPGLGDPGKLISLEVETGRSVDGLFTISGRDAGQQLLVTGTYNSGQQRDLGRLVSYQASPKDIVTVDETGFVSPIAEGEASIHIKSERGPDFKIKVQVTNIIKDLPVNFPNRIAPIFTKFGCNSGGCHGKSSGQNGFRLSLLGFEPTEDYEFLVKEARGRRIFPAAPERSLLLTKASGRLPHGGGHRIAADSPSFRMIYRWIEQGMPFGNEDDPVVVRIDVQPDERLMQRDGAQQIVAVAHYSNGST
ncbi:MAG: S-layer protein, partial [Pirellulaceae bacterium]